MQEIDESMMDLRPIHISYFDFPEQKICAENQSEYQAKINSKTADLAQLLKISPAKEVGFLLPAELSTGMFGDYIKALCKKLDIFSALSKTKGALILFREITDPQYYYIPLSVENIEITNIGSMDATVKWAPPKKGVFPIKEYTITLSSEKDTEIYHATSSTASFKIENLLPSSTYSILIQAVNKIGTGCKHLPVKFSTKPLSDDCGTLYYWGKVTPVGITGAIESSCTISPTCFSEGGNTVTYATNSYYNMYLVLSNNTLCEFVLKGETITPCIPNIKYVKQISCGNTFILALTQLGQIYGWGESKCGALGQGVDDQTLKEPTSINFKEELGLEIATSDNICVALTKGESSNKVYIWGSCPEIELKTTIREGYCLKNLLRPTKVPDEDTKGNVEHIYTCSSAIFLRCKNNDVLPIGIGLNGCLGIGPGIKIDSLLLPSIKIAFPCKAPYKIISFSCGFDHCLALLEDAESKKHIYGWGNNEYHKCIPLPMKGKKFYSPTEFVSTLDLVDVQCGTFHTMLMNKAGEIYAYGYSASGVLGVTSNMDGIIGTPTQVCKNIKGKSVVKMMACKTNSYAIIN